MNDDRKIESVIGAHLGVREVAVIRDEKSASAVFVVANDDYTKDALDGDAARCSAIAKWRKAYDLSQRTREALEAPVGFNTIGWNSSYTRQPIPAEEMHEWIDTTVADILRLAPRKVYEIGCGTGLLLAQIAPHCDSYIASDFAPAVLARLNELLQTMSSARDHIHVHERTADDFSGLPENSVDTVILSSVVQYFPSAAYLTKVLERAVNIVEPGGHIYVGDVRSLPLFPMFASSIELFQAPDEMPVEKLRDLIYRRMRREQELLLSPAYFLQLKHLFSKIAEVETRPLRGRFFNEMSGYRFQAIIHVGPDVNVLPQVEFNDWLEHRWSKNDIHEILRTHPRNILGIKKITNSRVESDVLTALLLNDMDASSSAADVRRRVSIHHKIGIDPQDLFDMESEGRFRVFLNWSACHHDGSYDALFIPNELVTRGLPVSISWPPPDVCEFVYLANWPGRRGYRDELIARLKDYCRERLPSETVPKTMTLVDSLPRKAVGGIDTDALLRARNSSIWL